MRESFAIFGETDVGGALPRATPICGVMGDSQASLFAQGCYEPGMAKATFGTGTSVLLNIGGRLKYLGARGRLGAGWIWRPAFVSSWGSSTTPRPRWLGWKDQLGLIANAEETERLAGSVPNNGGVYLVPAFAGLGAPYWSPTARAAILGVTAHSRTRHRNHTTLESIAYEIHNMLDMMRTTPAPLCSIYADGGRRGTSSLMQFTADMTRDRVGARKRPERRPWDGR